MLRKILATSWIWGIGIFINFTLSIHSFITLNYDLLILNLLCAVLCSVGYISAKYRGHM